MTEGIEEGQIEMFEGKAEAPDLATTNAKFIAEHVGGDPRLAAMLQAFAADGCDLYDANTTSTVMVAMLCSYVGLFHNDGFTFVGSINAIAKGAVDTSLHMAANFNSYQIAAKAPGLGQECGVGCGCGGQL